MEDRPGVKAEVMRRGVEDRHAEHVGRKEVAGELDPSVMQAQCAGERLRERGLSHPGDILDQEMAAREHTGERKLQRRVLAHDDTAKLLDHRCESCGDRDRVARGGGADGHGQEAPFLTYCSSGQRHYSVAGASSHDRRRRATLRSTAHRPRKSSSRAAFHRDSPP